MGVGEQGAALFMNDGLGRLGLGDTSRPVISLIGPPEITVEVEQAFDDPGATATDDVDGALTPAVDNPVDTKVIGTYVVTYTAKDSAGNAAVPVTRTVRVAAREASGGGGGGAPDAWLLVLLFCAGGALGRRAGSSPRASIQRRGASLSQHLAQTRASALEIGDLSVDGREPLALNLGSFRARHRAFDQAHAIRKLADLRQAETRRDQAPDLPDLADRDGWERPVTIAGADGREQAVRVVVTDRAHARPRLACKRADRHQGRLGNLVHID